MMKSVLDVTIGDQLTGELAGTVTAKYHTMAKDKTRQVAIVIDEFIDVVLPVTAVVAVKASA